jgi:hypothetical protein
MVHAFAIELLWLFYSPEECHGFPRFGRRYYPDQPPAPYFQKGYSVRIYRPWSLSLNLSMCSSTVHLADTRPYSPITLAYKPTTHTSCIGSTHAIYGESDHALTCAYRCPSFSISQLVSHNIMLRLPLVCLHETSLRFMS